MAIWLKYNGNIDKNFLFTHRLLVKGQIVKLIRVVRRYSYEPATIEFILAKGTDEFLKYPYKTLGDLNCFDYVGST